MQAKRKKHRWAWVAFLLLGPTLREYDDSVRCALCYVLYEICFVAHIYIYILYAMSTLVSSLRTEPNIVYCMLYTMYNIRNIYTCVQCVLCAIQIAEHESYAM